jgi:hypothetical protein
MRIVASALLDTNVVSELMVGAVWEFVLRRYGAT